MTRPPLPVRRPAGLLLPILAGALLGGCAGPADSPPGVARPAAGAEDVYCNGLVDVEGGVVQVAAPRGGVVAEIPVVEGSTVATGDLLLRLADDAEQLAVEAAQCRLHAAEDAVEAAAAEPEQFRLQVLQGEAMIRALEARLQNLRLRLETTRGLADLKQASRIDVLASEGLVEETARSLDAERAKLAALRLTDPARRVNDARRQVESARIVLREAQLAVSQLQLRAPCAARVLQINATASGVVNPGQPTLILQPERPLIVRIPVDAEFAQRIVPGLAAEARPDAGADAGRSWRGTVASVGGWFTTRRPVGPELVAPGDERTLECLVRLDDTAAEQPRIGLKVRVRIEAPPPATVPPPAT